MPIFHRIASGLSTAGAVLAGVSLVVITVFILLEIMLRGVFSTSTFLAEDVVSYGVAIITFGAMGYAMRDGVMVQVSLLNGRLPLVGQWVCEIIVHVATSALFLFLIRYMWVDVARNIRRGATTDGIVHIPLWLLSGILLVGMAILTLQLVSRLLYLLGGPARLAQEQQDRTIVDEEASGIGPT